jgi:hypothetical protein
MSEEMKSVRRVVTIDDNEGKSVSIMDGPSPDVRTDPARPGFSSARIWVADSSPPVIGEYQDTMFRPHTIEPPPGGSVCRVVTFPPDDTFCGRVGPRRKSRRTKQDRGPPGGVLVIAFIPQEAQQGVDGAPTGALFRLSRLRDATIRAYEARRVP